jgi:hypothetical protein
MRPTIRYWATKRADYVSGQQVIEIFGNPVTSAPWLDVVVDLR